MLITPVFLQVRSIRGDLSWSERIHATIDAFARWPDIVEDYRDYTHRLEQSGTYLGYYGRPRNVFDRMSYVNHVDLIKTGADSVGKIGWQDLSLAFEKAMPRFINPDKSLGYGQGAWIYHALGYPAIGGNYATAPLIGTGYAAFGWVGCFVYPLLLGLTWLLMVKKISGLDIHNNIWAIYFLVRSHNQFVEGSSDSYFVYILRILPQDTLVIILFLVFAAFLKARSYGPERNVANNLQG